MAKEIWKPVGTENKYMVSNLGNVKSLKRIVKHSTGSDKTINAKLSNKNIEQIKKIAIENNKSQEAIGKMFNVTQSHVSRIINGKGRNRG